MRTGPRSPLPGIEAVAPVLSHRDLLQVASPPNGKAGSVAQIVWDSLRYGNIVAGLYEQVHSPDLPHDELARLSSH